MMHPSAAVGAVPPCCSRAAGPPFIGRPRQLQQQRARAVVGQAAAAGDNSANCRSRCSSSTTTSSTTSSSSTTTSSSSNQEPSTLRRRRVLLSSAAAALATAASLQQGTTAWADEQQQLGTASAAADSSLELYENTQQRYRLSVPAGWERKDKAGADVLFEDPARRSSSVGVTVSPVRVAAISQFGDLDSVGQRLLDVERKKESTLGVELLSSSSRQGASGAMLYSYEYQLASTRGTKRLLNTVTITGSRLYILNAAFKCGKEDEGGCDADGAAAAIAQLRRVADSFDAGGGSI